MRQEAQRNLNIRTMTIATLLYTEKGMEEAGKIWGAFEKIRYERVADKDREAEEAEESWGCGELEGMEEARRDLNGGV